MEILRAVITFFIRLALELLYRVDKKSLVQFPRHGPLIVVINHTGKVEAPMLYSELYPRHMSALAKVENWENPLIAAVFNICEVVPVRRGEGDAQAMKKALAMLERGYIFGVAPEGTRSRTGRLGPGQPGVALLALHSGVTILPLVHWGGEKFGQNIRRLRRTDFHVRVGRPFRLDARGERVTREVRQQMADEIMYRLATLLPPEYRGLYSDLDAATENYIQLVDSPINPTETKEPR